MTTATKSHRLKPDCPWSWMVAVACASMNFFTATMTYSSGVVYTYIMELYRVSRQDAAWPLSIAPFSLNIVAPLVGIMVKKLDIRPVAIAGAVISSVSVSLCFFAPNLTYISVFLGGFYGIGSGMLIIPNAICINTWFDRKRVSASGLVHAGTTLSAFVFPTLFRYCADHFGLRGGFLIIGAIIMNATAFSIVIRSPPWTSKRGGETRAQRPPWPPKQESVSTALVRATAGGTQRHYSSFTSASEYARHGTDNQAFDAGQERTEAIPPSKGKQTVVYCNKHSSSVPGCDCCKYATGHDPPDTLNPPPLNSMAIEFRDTTHSDKWSACVLRRKSISISHSLDCPTFEAPRFNFATKQGDSTGSQLGLGNGKDGLELNAEETPQPVDSPKSDGKEAGLGTILFALVCLTFVVVMNSLMMFMTVVMDFAGDRGIPLKKSVYLLSGFAVADIAGRLGCGWATDGDRVSHKTVVGIFCLLLGVCYAVLPFLTTYMSIAAVIAMMGVAIGNCAALFTVVLSDAVGVKRIPAAMGIVGVCAGITALIRPFIIGYFRDQAGSYDDMLLAMGYAVIAVGVAVLLYRAVEVFQERKSWRLRSCAA